MDIRYRELEAGYWFKIPEDLPLLNLHWDGRLLELKDLNGTPENRLPVHISFVLEQYKFCETFEELSGVIEKKLGDEYKNRVVWVYHYNFIDVIVFVSKEDF